MSQYELPVLLVSDMPHVAFGSMNDTHSEEIELVNQLGEVLILGMRDNQFYDDISEKLEEWIEHAREHFSKEDQLMENCGFPALKVHSEEHQRVLEKMEALNQQWLDEHSIEPLAEYVFNEWVGWFDNHVNTMDMMTAQYLGQIFLQSAS
ncbi:hypothetical protein MNBD_GAMMA11-1721 [hydrothermal vent metagenome]|uniref:Hemerythrin-like domain-containing protein n=1 Tax=hydrothermal vent metagenome TaxID=652676 RepID=A0A3B0XE23_9ZZZZ